MLGKYFTNWAMSSAPKIVHLKRFHNHIFYTPVYIPYIPQVKQKYMLEVVKGAGGFISLDSWKKW